MTRNSLALLTFLLAFLHASAQAKPWFAPQYADSGVIQVWNSLEYFSTSANYDSGGGGFEKLNNGGSYKLIDWDFATRYYWSKELSFWAGFGLANAKSTSTSFDRNNTSMTEMSLGMQYRFRNGNWRIIPEGIFLYPFNRVKKDTDTVLTGEGAMVVEPAVWATYKWHTLTPYTRVGVRYRDEGRAILLPWLAGLDWRMGTLTLGGSVGGYQVIKDDDYVSAPLERDAVTTRVDGGSYKFYSINPSLLEAQLYAEGSLTQSMFVRFGIGKTINGKNNAEGLSAYVHLGWDLGKVTANVPEDEAVKKNPFEIEEQSYDENLFNTEVQPAPVDSKPKPKKKKKKRIDIDSVIKETEGELGE